MRVVTLNLPAPDQAEFERRRPVLAAGLRALDADVVALQETVWDADRDQAAELLGPGHHVARHSGRSPDGVARPTLDVVGCSLVLAEPVGGVWASDHFGVMADLEPPAHPPGTGWVDGSAHAG